MWEKVTNQNCDAHSLQAVGIAIEFSNPIENDARHNCTNENENSTLATQKV
jgi:hypothetical protein